MTSRELRDFTLTNRIAYLLIGFGAGSFCGWQSNWYAATALVVGGFLIAAINIKLWLKFDKLLKTLP